MLTEMEYLTVKTLTMNPKVTPTCGVEDRGQIVAKETVEVDLVRRDIMETVLTTNLFFRKNFGNKSI